MSRVQRKQEEKKIARKIAIKKYGKAGVMLGAAVISASTTGCIADDVKASMANDVNNNTANRMVLEVDENNQTVAKESVAKKAQVNNNEKKVVYKFINAENVKCYSIANPTEGYRPISYVNLELNDKVEVLGLKGNSTCIKVDGYRVWIESKFLSNNKVSVEVVSDTEVVETLATKEEVTVENTVAQKEETTKEEVTAENTVAQKEETTKEEVTVENTDNKVEETTSNESDKETEHEFEDPCYEENHDVHTCIEGLELVEGGEDTLTRTVTATNILGQEALVIKKGEKVVIGESRGNGEVSVLATNKHDEEVQLVIREDAVESQQVDHDEDCDVCIPEYAFGRFSDAYARTNNNTYLYPNACNDKDAIAIPMNQLLFIKCDAETVNGKVPASLDGGKTFGYYVELSTVEIDRRATQLSYLNTNDAIKLCVTKEIEAKGFGFNADKKVIIPAYTIIDVYLKSSDGSELAVSYDGETLLISVQDAISAGIY